MTRSNIGFGFQKLDSVVHLEPWKPLRGYLKFYRNHNSDPKEGSGSRDEKYTKNEYSRILPRFPLKIKQKRNMKKRHENCFPLPVA